MSWAKEQWKKSSERRELERIRKERRTAESKKFIEENTRVWFCEKTQMWWKSHPLYRDRLASDSEIKAAIEAAERGE